MSQSINFITPSVLKAQTGISTAIDDKQLMPVIKLAQDIFLQPALGSKLYLRLQAGVSDTSLSANEVILLQQYVKDCLVWATMANLPIALTYQFYAKGVLQKGAEESNTPSKNDLDSITQTYQNYAEFYKQRLINYLRTNYSLFSQYTDTTCSWDTIKPVTNGYDCPIYLGDEECGSCLPSGSSSSGTPASDTTLYTYVSAGGEANFVLSILDGKTILGATRAGLTKAITSSATADSNYLQRVGTAIILPTGDVTQAGEIFTFLYR